MNKKIYSGGALLLATIIWGSAFVSQRDAMGSVGPFTFQAVRCALAAVALFPLVLLTDRNKQDRKTFCSRWMDKTLWKAGIFVSIPLFFAINLQQIALVTTDAGKSAFLTAMYIVLVPILGLLIGRKPSKTVPFCVAIAVLGLYFLCCADTGRFRSEDFCLLGCAAAFAVQITVVDHYVAEVDNLRLNILQSAFCAIFSTVPAVLLESPIPADILSSWLPLCHAGILSMGIAYYLQIVGQRNMESSKASMIMSLEAVFAAIFGALVLHESMSGYQIFGCCLTFAAVILSQTSFSKK